MKSSYPCVSTCVHSLLSLIFIFAGQFTHGENLQIYPNSEEVPLELPTVSHLLVPPPSTPAPNLDPSPVPNPSAPPTPQSIFNGTPTIELGWEEATLSWDTTFKYSGLESHLTVGISTTDVTKLEVKDISYQLGKGNWFGYAYASHAKGDAPTGDLLLGAGYKFNDYNYEPQCLVLWDVNNQCAMAGGKCTFHCLNESGVELFSGTVGVFLNTQGDVSFTLDPKINLNNLLNTTGPR